MYRQWKLPLLLPNCYKVTPPFFYRTNHNGKQITAGIKMTENRMENMSAPQEKRHRLNKA